MDFRQVPAKSGQLSHFKQIIKHTSIEDILVIDGDIPRFRSKYRKIRERLNRWYNDKIVILWYSEEKTEKEPVKKVLERKNRCQQEYVLATAI